MEFPSSGSVESTPSIPLPTTSPLSDEGKSASDSQAFLLIEYQSLRAELSKRAQLQVLLLLLAVISAAGAIGFASNSTFFYLAEPIFVLLLATLWLQQQQTIRTMVVYIRENLESHWGSNGGWERWAQRRRVLDSSVNSRLVYAAMGTARGIFLGVQVLMLALLLFLNPFFRGWTFPYLLFWCFDCWTAYRVWSLFDMETRAATNE